MTEKLRDGAWKGRKGRAVRRGKAIHAYVGPNGGGKSLAMVYDTLPTLDGHGWSCDDAAHRHVQEGEQLEGQRRVLSTVPLYAADGEPHELYDAFTDFRQLLVAEHCDVLMDEVTGVASSRESASMPVQVANFLVQLRRRDVVLRWTAPNFRRADVIMREVTQAVTECRGFMPKDRADGSGRMWRDRRLFIWRTYDAAEFDDWSAGKKDKVSKLASSMLWRPGSLVERSYNTLEGVEALGAANEAGRCMVCWGKRAVPKCCCSTADVEAFAASLATV